MLEIINGVLLVYFLILCTISALVPQLVKPVAACFSRPSNNERNVWAELLKLKADQKKISMKDEFAQYSKLQRKINKLESQLKENSQDRLTKNVAVKGSVHIILQAVITLTIIVSMFLYRHEPLVLLKGNLFPLTRFLRFPCDIPNAVTTHVWVIISNVSIRTLLKPILS
ncbi:hypothetical protein JYU34_001860 [Plutella xylostella]|uniref:Guided entry of tail-anchored proteins factor 1 n=2 Tax=Plutella xylostella TaxID=51655 RepID=A0A8S4FSX3_PLUXY|nr:guided entry of tail-anchored proteins factor 1 [Plutella xylostella]KAG7312372.1 hypothetical protein JYU34_001860 [Plutella xylostella]CAG9130598.1 unnamed protein product [Plutella xylostella]